MKFELPKIMFVSFSLTFLMYNFYCKTIEGDKMGKYIELTAENFNVAKEGVALVDFWAPWCGPCRMLAPVIDELAEEFDGKAKICKVNTDEVQDLAVEYGVRSIPTLLFFKDGEIKETLIGAQSKAAIADKINSLL